MIQGLKALDHHVIHHRDHHGSILNHLNHHGHGTHAQGAGTGPEAVVVAQVETDLAALEQLAGDLEGDELDNDGVNQNEGNFESLDPTSIEVDMEKSGNNIESSNAISHPTGSLGISKSKEIHR